MAPSAKISTKTGSDNQFYDWFAVPVYQSDEKFRTTKLPAVKTGTPCAALDKLDAPQNFTIDIGKKHGISIQISSGRPVLTITVSDLVYSLAALGLPVEPQSITFYNLSSLNAAIRLHWVLPDLFSKKVESAITNHLKFLVKKHECKSKESVFIKKAETSLKRFFNIINSIPSPSFDKNELIHLNDFLAKYNNIKSPDKFLESQIFLGVTVTNGHRTAISSFIFEPADRPTSSMLDIDSTFSGENRRWAQKIWQLASAGLSRREINAYFKSNKIDISNRFNSKELSLLCGESIKSEAATKKRSA